MEYRRMSEEMSSQEVHLLMKVLIPEAEVRVMTAAGIQTVLM